MSNASKRPDKLSKEMRIHAFPNDMARKAMLQALPLGESIVFVCEPGVKPGRLQASIASSFRGLESMSQQGLEQQSGLLVFEGEPAIAVSRVTRVAEPRE